MGTPTPSLPARPFGGLGSTPPRAGAEGPLRPEGEDARRFRAMVDAHFAFIWRALRGLGVPSASADDAAQQVFLIASRKVADIEVGAEKSFLFSTALGVAANARRSVARRREVADDVALEGKVDEAPDPEQALEMREKRAQMEEVLDAMPDDLRTVFVLFVLEGGTAPEISEMLGIAVGTVASRVRRARKAFQENARRIQARTTMLKGGAR